MFNIIVQLILFSKYSWESEKSASFRDVMYSDQVKCILDEAVSLIDVDVNLALGKFNECFKISGECMLKNVYFGTERRRAWFDLECKQSRRLLRQLLRKVNRFNVQEDRLIYIEKDVNIRKC